MSIITRYHKILFSLCVAVLFFAFTTNAADAGCDCRGTVSIKSEYTIFVTEDMAAQIESVCAAYGGFYSNYTCIHAKVPMCAANEAACTATTPEQIAEQLGFDSSYLSYLNVDMSCTWDASTPTVQCASDTTNAATANTTTSSSSSPSSSTGSGSTSTLPNPLPGVSNPNQLIANIIKAFLGVVGGITLFIFVYGGFMLLISAGNSDRVQKGQQTIMWAVIGLIIIFAAYGISDTLFKALSGNTPTSSETLQRSNGGTTGSGSQGSGTGEPEGPPLASCFNIESGTDFPDYATCMTEICTTNCMCYQGSCLPQDQVPGQEGYSCTGKANGSTCSTCSAGEGACTCYSEICVNISDTDQQCFSAINGTSCSGCGEASCACFEGKCSAIIADTACSGAAENSTCYSPECDGGGCQCKGGLCTQTSGTSTDTTLNPCLYKLDGVQCQNASCTDGCSCQAGFCTASNP